MVESASWWYASRHAASQAGLQCLKGVLQLQGELPSVLGTSLDELLRHVGSLRSQVLQVVVSIFDKLCELGSTSPHSALEPSSQVAAPAPCCLRSLP